MLISDLIEKLEECKTEIGDVQILACDDYGNTDDFECVISINDCNENVVLLVM